MNNQFELPGSFKKWTLGTDRSRCTWLCYTALLCSTRLHQPEAMEESIAASTRFWAVLVAKQRLLVT
jgi:hypothetical protein